MLGLKKLNYVHHNANHSDQATGWNPTPDPAPFHRANYQLSFQRKNAELSILTPFVFLIFWNCWRKDLGAPRKRQQGSNLEIPHLAPRCFPCSQSYCCLGRYSLACGFHNCLLNRQFAMLLVKTVVHAKQIIVISQFHQYSGTPHKQIGELTIYYTFANFFAVFMQVCDFLALSVYFFIYISWIFCKPS